MPSPPLLAISTADEVSPAAPISCIASTASARHQLKARLHQQFPRQGVAHLHRGAFGLVAFAEFC